MVEEYIEYFESLWRKPRLRRRWYWTWMVGPEPITDGAQGYFSEGNVLRAIEENVNSKLKTPLPVRRRA